MTTPFVSVILPIYNGESFLVDAIDSILSQSFTNFELIIINDGSSDSSLSIAQEYQKKDARVVLVSQDNIGLIKTLNKGIVLAKGKYIARMDQDDIALEDRLFEQVNLLEKGYDLCGCHFHFVTESGKLSKSRVVSVDPNFQSIILTRSTPFAHGSVLIRKSFLIDNNLRYDEKKYLSAEDYYLWAQCYTHGAKLANVDKYLFLYRDFSFSLSKINAKRNLRDAKLISKMFIKNNFNQIESNVVLRVSTGVPLNSFEQEQLAFFVFKTLFKRPLSKSVYYLRLITTDIKVVALLRHFKTFLF